LAVTIIHITGAECECCADALLVRGPDAADPVPQRIEVLALALTRWPSATGGQEEELGALLIGVPERTAIFVIGRD
jgi:hypothetical protein